MAEKQENDTFTSPPLHKLKENGVSDCPEMGIDPAVRSMQAGIGQVPVAVAGVDSGALIQMIVQSRSDRIRANKIIRLVLIFEGNKVGTCQANDIRRKFWRDRVSVLQAQTDAELDIPSGIDSGLI